MANCVLGLEKHDTCELYIDGLPVAIKTIHDAIRNGIGYISEDRKNFGILGGMSVRDNITIVNLDRFLKMGFISRKKEAVETNEQIAKMKIKVSSMFQRSVTLSGGNQQKMLLSRWLLNKPRIFIISEPTRGIDVGAKMEIYQIMRNLVNAGNGIIMISSELPEIIGLSDRILVMRSGGIAGEIDQAVERASEEQVMSLAVGHQYSIKKGLK